MSNERTFRELHKGIGRNHTRCLYSTFHPVPVNYLLEFGVSIQYEFRRQDDGILMILSKQSESTKVGLSG